MTTTELKASVKAGNGRAKLTVCEELVQESRMRLWEGRSWSWNDRYENDLYYSRLGL